MMLLNMTTSGLEIQPLSAIYLLGTLLDRRLANLSSFPVPPPPGATPPPGIETPDADEFTEVSWTK